MYRLEDIEYSTYRVIRVRGQVRMVRNTKGIEFSYTSVPLTLDQVKDFYNYTSGVSTVNRSDNPELFSTLSKWITAIYTELYKIWKSSNEIDEDEGTDKLRICSICGGMLSDSGECLRCNPETQSDYEDAMQDALRILQGN